MADRNRQGNRHHGNTKRADAGDYFTQPLTLKQAKRQSRIVARIQTQPERRQIKAEQRAEDVQHGRIKDYFQPYQQGISDAAATSADAYAKAQASIDSSSQNSAQYAEMLRQRLQQEGAQDAATRGVAYNPQPDQTAVAAELARLNSANTLKGVTAAQGASTAAMYADKARIGKREKAEQLLRSDARRRTYDQDLIANARQRGDLAAQNFAQIKNDERDYLLSQQAANLNAKGQKLDAAQARAQLAETRRHNQTSESISAQNASTSARNAQTSRMNARTSRRSEQRQRRQDRYERRHPNAGQDNPNATDRADVQQASALIRQLDPKWLSKASQQQIIDALVTKDQTISPKEARKALQANLSYVQQAATR